MKQQITRKNIFPGMSILVNEAVTLISLTKNQVGGMNNNSNIAGNSFANKHFEM